MKNIFAILALFAATCGSGVVETKGPANTRNDDEQKNEEEELEETFEEFERRMAKYADPAIPAVVAFKNKDVETLRKWISKRDLRPAYRTYGAFLLHKLGDSEGKKLFIEYFPYKDEEEYGLFWDMTYSMSKKVGRLVPMYAQKELICGAIRGWEGATDIVMELGPITNASGTTDNHCGLALLVEEDPKYILELVFEKGRNDEIVHAFEEEAGTILARKVLKKIEIVEYENAEAEELRKRLLPVLKEMAESEFSEGACAHIRCE